MARRRSRASTLSVLPGAVLLLAVLALGGAVLNSGGWGAVAPSPGRPDSVPLGC